MIKGHRINKKIDIDEFNMKMSFYSKEQIECTPYTLFRLSQKQRKIFKCQTLKDLLLEKMPVLVGIQNNGYYTTFYKYKKSTYRVVLNIKTKKVKIITFYVVDQHQIPILK